MASVAASLSASLATLLRTRAPYDPETLARHNLTDSVLGYGLPDISMHDPETPRGRAAISAVVLDAIRRHEPRLDGIMLTGTRLAPNLSLVIELKARLRGENNGRSLTIRARLDRGRDLANLRCEPSP